VPHRMGFDCIATGPDQILQLFEGGSSRVEHGGLRFEIS
jgi:hypothetical protein